MRTVQLSLSLEVASDIAGFQLLVSKNLGLKVSEISCIKLVKRSVDARKQAIKINLTFEVYLGNQVPENTDILYKDVCNARKVAIIGSGPAGLFAALKLIEAGIKPIIIEQGSAVEKRKHDIASMHQNRLLNENSNYCFGEGGAGTYSDGKLYTRSSKRGDVGKILKVFCNHGASDEILYETHAHIGTDKLPAIIASIRKTIIDCGGEIYFDTKITDLKIVQNNIAELIADNGNTFTAEAIILATGHSSDSIYKLLLNKKIHIEAKPFALGFRVEHPQEMIDSIQYHSINMRKYLPAASYSLVDQIDGRGVYSFCMCPGGTVIPASTSQNSLVLNGMSSSRRNLKYANSGLVVSLELSDFDEFNHHGALAGLAFREKFESQSFLFGGSDYTAPAQKMTDFVKSKISDKQLISSYSLGVHAAPLHDLYPDFITNRLKKAFLSFDRKMKGFFSNEALLLAPETRTSSPVRIPRDRETLEHVQIKNLFPCGEGAGYSGGIVSSAIDGERCAQAIVNKLRME